MTTTKSKKTVEDTAADEQFLIDDADPALVNTLEPYAHVLREQYGWKVYSRPLTEEEYVELRMLEHIKTTRDGDVKQHWNMLTYLLKHLYGKKWRKEHQDYLEHLNG